MRLPGFSTKTEPEYHALGDVNAVLEQRPSGSARSLRDWVILGFIVLISIGVGFFGGRQSLIASPAEEYGLLKPQGTIHQVWEHNLTFSQKPTPESEGAWSSIVPIGRGFVHHPQVAPFISNIAVFHQLHCLHGIRVAYYTTLHELEKLNGTTDRDEFIEQVGAKTDNVHMRHCFDYLRQAIMCAADTNLEHVSEKTRITTGWGSEKVCRDYWGVLDWAEKYANSSDTGIL